MPRRHHNLRTVSILPRFRILWGEEIALGPGKVELLKAIAATGSIAEAAKRMEMSYNRAWQLVRTMNLCFPEALVESARGGATGGGARLSATGLRVLALYRRLEIESARATYDAQEEIRALLKK